MWNTTCADCAEHSPTATPKSMPAEYATLAVPRTPLWNTTLRDCAGVPNGNSGSGCRRDATLVVLEPVEHDLR
ncbi:MAG: hypothetical protein IPH63_17815 [Flavobacteriales bacterium]|nr:hypothetical protein [Flavobacteriales bacterium]